MSFAFATPKQRRRPSLTPMIDVVFLLLVFFMLVSRFGIESAVPLGQSGAAAGYQGPPRLIDVTPDGLLLNGVAMAPDALLSQLSQLSTDLGDAVVLRPREGADVQTLVRAMELLQQAGHSNLLLVE